MHVREAQAIARQWVREHAESIPNFRGAFFTGSITSLPPENELPPTSDLDLFIVLADEKVPLKIGKIIFREVLLEVSFISFDELRDVNHVATNYHLAHPFARDNIISDPTGHLGAVHAQVSQTFNSPNATRSRCENAIEKITRGLSSIDVHAAWHDQVLSWVFPTGVTTHVILVAANQNPTVRLRYLAARRVLESHGRSDVYARLLDLLGCGAVTREQVQRHLDALTTAFNLASPANAGHFFFSSDISSAARPLAIDGAQRLIDAGDHREAVFWIVVTFARCMKILNRPADERFRTAADELLGLSTPADLPARSQAVLDFLPQLRWAADAILLATKTGES